MNEDIIILLEWFRANGISELFNNTPCINYEDNIYVKDIINVSINKNVDNVFNNLAKQQEEIKQNNSLLPIQYIIDAKNLCDSINSIDCLGKCLDNFQGCCNLKKLATNTIMYNGNTNGKILIINDYPNENDDAEGKIFSGESEILMHKMLKAIDINTDDCCFLNSFFWRLAGNRIPIKEEFEICKPFVEKFIALLRPKLIIFTGNYSISSLTNLNSSLVKVRGQFFDYTNAYMYNTIKSMPIFNPNFLIKNNLKKKEAWQDLLLIKSFLENN